MAPPDERLEVEDLELSIDRYDPTELAGRVTSLGRTRASLATGRHLVVPDSKSGHVYIRGRTGVGKSRLLQAMIAQDIVTGHPLVLVDPTGSLYRPSAQLVAYLTWQVELLTRQQGLTDRERAEYVAELARFMRQFILLDFGREHGYRHNPLFVGPGETITNVVGDFLKAVSRLIGDLNEMRRLKNILGSACKLLAAMGGNLLDVVPLLRSFDEPQSRFQERLEAIDRRAAAEAGFRVQIAAAREYMGEFFAQLTKGQRLERMESTINAINVWLGDPPLRRFVDCVRGNIDFGDVLATGKTVLCHIPLGWNEDTTRVLGGFVVNKVQRMAYRRPAGHRPPFKLYADEFHLFVDQETAVATATTRQYGLKFVLAHQSARQPPLNTEEGAGVLETIMANSGTKIFFRVGAAEASDLAREVFLAKGRLIKRSYLDFTESESTTDAWSFSRNTSRTFSRTFTASVSASVTEAESNTLTVMEGDGFTRAIVEGTGITISEGEGRTQTVSESDGITITQGSGETHIESAGSATGRSSSRGGSSTSGKNTGTSITHGDNGTVVTLRPGTGTGSAGAGSMSSGESEAIAHVESIQNSSGSSYSDAVSNVISQAKSLARQNSTSTGTSKTTTRANGVSVTRGIAISESLAKSIGIVKNHSRSWATGVSRAVSLMRGYSVALGESDGDGTTDGESGARARGSSSRFVTETYSVDEEVEIMGQLLYTLPARQAWVVLPDREDTLGDDEFAAGGELQAVEVKTHPMPDELPVVLDGKNYLDALIALEAKLPEDPPPTAADGSEAAPPRPKRPRKPKGWAL